MMKRGFGFLAVVGFAIIYGVVGALERGAMGCAAAVLGGVAGSILLALGIGKGGLGRYDE